MKKACVVENSVNYELMSLIFLRFCLADLSEYELRLCKFRERGFCTGDVCLSLGFSRARSHKFWTQINVIIVLLV